MGRYGRFTHEAGNDPESFDGAVFGGRDVEGDAALLGSSISC